MGNSWCRGARKPAANDGSVLDRVISQASNEDDCLLYRLANYKNGGELIDAYNVGGQAEVEKLIKEQFGVLMYAEGRGQVIKRAEYLRWKFRDLQHVVLPIEASLSPHDPLAKWEDHEACWQMQYRGSLGETLLHVLIICDMKLHTRLARMLIKCYPKLALDVVEGEEYLGASALHLAIAYANNELVQDLVEAGANVMQRAIGSFFLPRDQQLARPKKHTDYEGLAYLGEYPLAWAACCANESVYNLLCDSGANPDAQDSFGNMILHMVVVCDKLDMFGYALRHPRLPASNGIANDAGLTPLTLACELGRAEVFREMLELSCREFWRYSNITCSAYPLNALDTLLPDGRTNWNSALFIILNGTKEEHLDMLDGGIIQRLLEEKWKTFARQQFLKRLAILFLHLVTMSMAVYLRPERSEPLLEQWDLTTVLRTGFEIGTLCNIGAYIFFQQGGEIKNQGLGSFIKQLGHAPAKAIFLVSNLMILLCIPFRLNGDRNTESAILVFAVPGSWFLLMFFAGAVRLTGPFVTMVYSMIAGDMLTFGMIYTVVLFGFSQSFYFLYKGFPGVKDSLYDSYPSTWMALFQITLGDYNYSDLSSTTYPSLSKTVFAIFMVLVPILLLNMLIAMMGNTYAHVIEQSEKEWMKQWAKIVVSLERAVNQSDAHHYLQEYSIKLGGDDPATEQRGVMVIKSKSKTRAKQRKGAVSNWKRVGKVTINELRKRGMSGEQLRRLMWGRASISTPVKAPRGMAKAMAAGAAGAAGVGAGLGAGVGGVGGLAGALTDPFAIADATKLVDPSADKAKSQGQGFAALSGALDIMAFANDLSAPGAAPAPGLGPGGIAPKMPNGAVPGMLALGMGAAPKPGFVPEVVPPQMNNFGAKVPIIPTIGVPEDPLRELVLVAELPPPVPRDRLEALARRAAETDHLEEVTPEEMGLGGLGLTVPRPHAPAPGTGPRDRKVSITLEPSDSDDFGEGPLLGRGARLRRARSARSRGQPETTRRDDGYSSSTASSFDAGMLSPFSGPPPLYSDASPSPLAAPPLYCKPPAPSAATTPCPAPAPSAPSPVPPTQAPPGPVPVGQAPQVQASQVPQSQSSAPPAYQSPPAYQTPQLQPTAMNHATGSPPTAPENDPGNGKKEHKHSRQRHRPKTAKPNRVAPTPDAPPRRGMSAGPTATASSGQLSHGSGSGSGSNDSGSPGSGGGGGAGQDPLEPWSVRGIEPMNALLAWDQDDHDSL